MNGTALGEKSKESEGGGRGLRSEAFYAAGVDLVTRETTQSLPDE